MNKKLLAYAGSAALLAGVWATPAQANNDDEDGTEEGPAPTVETSCEEGKVTITNTSELTLVAGDNDTPLIVDAGEAIEETAPEGDNEVSWRLFGGPERDNDYPLWSIHPDVNEDYTNDEMIDEVEAFDADWVEEGNDSYSWTTDGVEGPAPFVTWDAFTVEGCPSEEEEPTEEETEEEPSEEETTTEEAAQLPETGSNLPVIAASAGGLLALGGALALLAWKRRAANAEW